MFYFLYKSGRHEDNSRWRFKQTTSRGDFNREMLHRCIRGKYEVINYGDHPAQKLLEKIDMENSFYGHILKIDNPKSAVWIKLNHEQVGKNGTVYVGAWKDIDEVHLASLTNEVEELRKKQIDYHNQRNTLNYNNHYVQNMLNALVKHRNNDVAGFTSEMTKAIEIMDTLKLEFDLLNKSWTKHGLALEAEMQQARAKVQAYLDEKKY